MTDQERREQEERDRIAAFDAITERSAAEALKKKRQAEAMETFPMDVGIILKNLAERVSALEARVTAD